VERVIIHYEPEPRAYLRIGVPLADPDGALSNHFGDSPYFAIAMLRLSDNQIEKQEIIKNPYTHIKRAKGIQVAEWLVEKNVDEVAISEDIKHKGPGYVFSDAGVKVHVISAKTLEDALSYITNQSHSVTASQGQGQS